MDILLAHSIVNVCPPSSTVNSITMSDREDNESSSLPKSGYGPG